MYYAFRYTRSAGGIEDKVWMVKRHLFVYEWMLVVFREKSSKCTACQSLVLTNSVIHANVIRSPIGDICRNLGLVPGLGTGQ
jgi:hypothetical protein